MVKIITIHGTNAGADSDNGDQWWQKGSPFHMRLQQLIEEPLEFEPFHWSGKNSELERRRWGNKLASKLGAEPEPPIVIGHSHGGSVLLHALFRLTGILPVAAVEKLRSVVTVGTPAFTYHATWNWIARYNILGQIPIIIGFVFLAIYTIALLPIIAVNIDRIFTGRPITDSFVMYILFMITVWGVFVFLVSRFGARRAKRNKAFQKNKLISVFGEKYAALNHTSDEAISALLAAKNISFTIVSSLSVRRAVRPFIIGIVALGLCLYALSMLLQAPSLRENLILGRVGDIVTAGHLQQTNEMVIGVSNPSFPGLWSRGAELKGQAKKYGDKRNYFQKTIFLNWDYVVLDYATALEKRTPQELEEYINALTPTAQARFACFQQPAQTCDLRAVALYLTGEDKNRLIAAARALQGRTFDAPRYADVSIQDALEIYGAVSTNVAVRDAPLKAVINDANQGPMSVIVESRLATLSENALVSWSSVPPPQSDLRALVSYPALRAGDALLVSRHEAAFLWIECGLLDLSLSLSRVVNRSGADSGRLDDDICSTFEISAPNILDIVAFSVRSFDTLLPAQSLNDFHDAINALDGPEIRLYISGIFMIVALTVLILAWTMLIELSVAFIVTPLLKAAFNIQLKNALFGNDGYGEKVVKVSSGMDFATTSIGTLPKDIEEDIAEYTQVYSTRAIQKMREIVSLSAADTKTALVSQLAESLTWKELIHTAYFDVDSFISHVAVVLSERAGLTLVEKPLPTPHWAASVKSSAAFA